MTVLALLGRVLLTLGTLVVGDLPLLVDPVTAPQLPNGDVAMGLPLNSVALALQLAGTTIASTATPT